MERFSDDLSSLRVKDLCGRELQGGGMFAVAEFYVLQLLDECGDEWILNEYAPMRVIEVALPLVKFATFGAFDTEEIIINTSSRAFISARPNTPKPKAEDVDDDEIPF